MILEIWWRLVCSIQNLEDFIHTPKTSWSTIYFFHVMDRWNSILYDHNFSATYTLDKCYKPLMSHSDGKKCFVQPSKIWQSTQTVNYLPVGRTTITTNSICNAHNNLMEWYWIREDEYRSQSKLSAYEHKGAISAIGRETTRDEVHISRTMDIRQCQDCSWQHTKPAYHTG